MIDSKCAPAKGTHISCIECGYDLFGSPGLSCPECCCAISRSKWPGRLVAQTRTAIAGLGIVLTLQLLVIVAWTIEVLLGQIGIIDSPKMALILYHAYVFLVLALALLGLGNSVGGIQLPWIALLAASSLLLLLRVATAIDPGAVRGLFSSAGAPVALWLPHMILPSGMLVVIYAADQRLLSAALLVLFCICHWVESWLVGTPQPAWRAWLVDAVSLIAMPLSITCAVGFTWSIYFQRRRFDLYVEPSFREEKEQRRRGTC